MLKSGDSWDETPISREIYATQVVFSFLKISGENYFFDYNDSK